MSLSRFQYSAAVLSLFIPAVSCVTARIAIAAASNASIRIDSVADKYAVQNVSFEVNPETKRAGIRLEYVYPPELVGDVDGYWVPAPKIVVVPNLTYDVAAGAVVYNDGVKTTTCAVAAGQRVLLWKVAIMKPTGACMVSSRLTTHERDNGWSIAHLRTMDTYFEVRQ
jgi:hypothetical protein